MDLLAVPQGAEDDSHGQGASACHRPLIPAEALGKGHNIRVLQEPQSGANLLF